MEKDILCNANYKKTWVAIRKKVDLKTVCVSRDKLGHFKMTKRSMYQVSRKI